MSEREARPHPWLRLFWADKPSTPTPWLLRNTTVQVQRHNRGVLRARHHCLNKADLQPESRPLISQARMPGAPQVITERPSAARPLAAAGHRDKGYSHHVAQPAGRLSPSKAGARAEGWGLGARRLTVRSLSVPPLWFSMQVYTVEPGARQRPRGCEPLGAARHHRSA